MPRRRALTRTPSHALVRTHTVQARERAIDAEAEMRRAVELSDRRAQSAEKRAAEAVEALARVGAHAPAHARWCTALCVLVFVCVYTPVCAYVCVCAYAACMCGLVCCSARSGAGAALAQGPAHCRESCLILRAPLLCTARMCPAHKAMA